MPQLQWKILEHEGDFGGGRRRNMMLSLSHVTLTSRLKMTTSGALPLGRPLENNRLSLQDEGPCHFIPFKNNTAAEKDDFQ